VSAHAAGLGNGYSLQHSCLTCPPLLAPAVRTHASLPALPALRQEPAPPIDLKDQNASFPVRHRTASHRTAPPHRNAAVGRDSCEARRRVVVVTLFWLDI
jgi:hypothetical protein